MLLLDNNHPGWKYVRWYTYLWLLIPIAGFVAFASHAEEQARA